MNGHAHNWQLVQLYAGGSLEWRCADCERREVRVPWIADPVLLIAGMPASREAAELAPTSAPLGYCAAALAFFARLTWRDPHAAYAAE